VIDKQLDHLEVLSLALSPNGRLLASGGQDSVIRLWDIAKDSYSSLEFHQGPVLSLAFSPDGKTLVSGGHDQRVLLWDVEKGRPMVPPLYGHRGAVLSVDFNPDGKSFASSGNDGDINTWHVGSSLVSMACRIAGRNFTAQEWKRYFADQEFRVTCPDIVINAADESALVGDKSGAERLFAQAMRLVEKSQDSSVHNLLCWLGGVDGFATLVQPACERAVALAPEAYKSWCRDSRGLVRALTGDNAGAIEDFTAMLEVLNALANRGGYTQSLQRRRHWIAALKQGIDPFLDEALLRSLRVESGE
jgi:hypothetical protein